MLRVWIFFLILKSSVYNTFSSENNGRSMKDFYAEMIIYW